MLKEHWRFISRVERLGDFIIIILSFFAAYYGRASLIYWNQQLGWGIPFGGDQLAPIQEYLVILFVALVSYTAFLNLLGAYSSMRLSSSWRLLRIAIVSSVLTFFALGSVLYLLKLDYSRSFIGLFCFLVGLAFTAERYVVLEFLRYWRRRGRNFRNILICGVGDQAVRIASGIVRSPELGIRIRGFVFLGGNADLDVFRKDVKRVGCDRPGRLIRGVSEVKQALRDYAIDEVIFADVLEVIPAVEELILHCSEQGVRTTIAADLFSIGMVKSGISYFGDIPLIHFQTPPGDRWELAVKRIVDVIGSAMALLILIPLLGVITAVIRFSSSGPIFFTQKRVGLNGRLFDLYKFRSMVPDAEKQLEKLREGNEMSGPVFKMKDDPRITSVGRFLRRFSLDELPQLWNVLRGEMSLVGPRPPVPGEVSMYKARDRRRLSMRPGITCIWQVSGRNEIRDFDRWVELDLEYIDNWSLSRDFWLMVRTVPAVLFGTGAR